MPDKKKKLRVIKRGSRLALLDWTSVSFHISEAPATEKVKGTGAVGMGSRQRRKESYKEGGESSGFMSC